MRNEQNKIIKKGEKQFRKLNFIVEYVFFGGGVLADNT